MAELRKGSTIGGDIIASENRVTEIVDDIMRNLQSELGVTINDSIASTISTYSSNKLNSLLSSKADIIDTLNVAYGDNRYYRKIEIDNFLSLYYTKLNIDSLLDNIYIKSQVYTKDESYNKIEVDNLFSNYKTQVDETFSTYYNKTDVDLLLSNYYLKTDFDIVNYNTKDEINSILLDYYKKEEIDSTLSNYYTKSEVNNSFSNYYTKSEIDATKVNYIYKEIPIGATDGINTTFNLQNTPISDTEQVFKNGVLQDSGVGNDYILIGNKITFYRPPSVNSKIRVNYTH